MLTRASLRSATNDELESLEPWRDGRNTSEIATGMLLQRRRICSVKRQQIEQISSNQRPSQLAGIPGRLKSPCRVKSSTFNMQEIHMGFHRHRHDWSVDLMITLMITAYRGARQVGDDHSSRDSGYGVL